MEIWALCAGDLGFISAPYEMFCSNDSYDHMADDTTFNYDVYETNTRRYGRGTAEKLAENFVEMLTELKS